MTDWPRCEVHRTFMQPRFCPNWHWRCAVRACTEIAKYSRWSLWQRRVFRSALAVERAGMHHHYCGNCNKVYTHSDWFREEGCEDAYYRTCSDCVTRVCEASAR